MCPCQCCRSMNVLCIGSLYMQMCSGLTVFMFIPTCTYASQPEYYSIIYIYRTIHPGKLTWIPKIAMFKGSYLFQGIILGIHVSFWGCILHRLKSGKVIDFIAEQWENTQFTSTHVPGDHPSTIPYQLVTRSHASKRKTTDQFQLK